MKLKRCPKCRRSNTLKDISGAMQRINPFVYRSFTGQMYTLCNYTKKEYVFKDVDTEKDNG